MVDIPFHQIGIEAGGGAVVGTMIGFAVKKLAKLIAVVVGLELATFKLLEMRGLLEVNWSAINGAASDATTASVALGSSPPPWLMNFLTTLPISAGVVSGFLVGFKMG